jgi:Phosphate-selective porin O and P
MRHVERVCLSGLAQLGSRFGAAVAVATVAAMGVSEPARAGEANDALLRLMQVLRDRGSISAQEYDEIRKIAEASEPASVSAAATGPKPVAALAVPAAQAQAASSKDTEQDKAIADLRTATTGNPAPVVRTALAGKWYERLQIRGYTQLRYAEVASQRGAVLEVPVDRSVNPNESFGIRRGRVVIQGDVADHLSLYAQSDFNGSPGTADYAVQMRDLYGDVWLDKAKTYRVRVGQSKVPYGWVNMQSSSNRAPMERPDALNSAVEGERDLGAFFMWENQTAKQRFRELGNASLKGSGDYGVLSAGLYSGQGLNRSDQNGNPHAFVRAAYPFKTKGGKFYELAVQGYRGLFVAPTQAVSVGGVSITPTQSADGVLDERVAVTAVLYPQPFGIETEWTFGRGPQLSSDYRRITAEKLHGGYVQLNYSLQHSTGRWLPFARWHYFDGARKFARNAPVDEVNEVDLGVEFAKWAEVELMGMFTHTFRRTRTSTFPYGLTRDANRFGLQVQWNY